MEESKQAIQPGDVVRLKSGRPAMTVDKPTIGGFRCTWFQNNELKEGIFKREAIELYKKDK